jgi:TP901 family phage tail tape measure protein
LNRGDIKVLLSVNVEKSWTEIIDAIQKIQEKLTSQKIGFEIPFKIKAEDIEKEVKAVVKNIDVKEFVSSIAPIKFPEYNTKTTKWTDIQKTIRDTENQVISFVQVSEDAIGVIQKLKFGKSSTGDQLEFLSSEVIDKTNQLNAKLSETQLKRIDKLFTQDLDILDSSRIDQVVEAYSKVKEASKNLSNASKEDTYQMRAELERYVNEYERLSRVLREQQKEQNKYATSVQDFADKQKEFADRLFYGGTVGEDALSPQRLEQLKGKYKEVVIAIEALKQAGLGEAETHKQIVREKIIELQKLDKELKSQQRSEIRNRGTDETYYELTKLLKDMENLSNTYERAFSSTTQQSNKFRKELERLTQETKQLLETQTATKSGTRALKKEFAILEREVKNSSFAVKTFSERLKETLLRYSTWTIASRGIQMTIRYLKQMVQTVTDIDTAMTELRRVSDVTEGRLYAFLEGSTQRAKALGASMSDVVNATSAFARMGYGLEEARSLGEIAIIFKNIGDNVNSIDNATNAIISILNAFGLESKEAIRIVDRLNEVSNRFSVTSGDLAAALQRSSAALKVANNTLDESLALITTAQTVVQNAESVGTTLKTVSMRIRGAKVELEEMGESTEGMAESVSQLQVKLKALTGVDVMKSSNEFKSTYQVLDELSQVWNTLDDISKAATLELIAGKRGAQAVAAILDNFEIAKKALETSETSFGSALRENQIYLDSIEGRTAQLKASFQSLSTTMIDDKIVKDAISLLSTLLSLLEKIVKIFDFSGAGGATVIAGMTAFTLSLSKNAGKNMPTTIKKVA